jgi:hypothetical protein
MPDAERITELEAQLAEREREIAHLRRAGDIDSHLRDADAVDVETARLLVEARLESANADDAHGGAADLPAVIADLKRDKPFLFSAKPAAAPPGRAPRAASSPRLDPRPRERIEHAAAEARSSGRMADLLRYMRLRRKFAQRE